VHLRDIEGSFAAGKAASANRALSDVNHLEGGVLIDMSNPRAGQHETLVSGEPATGCVQEHIDHPSQIQVDALTCIVLAVSGKSGKGKRQCCRDNDGMHDVC
jgi:hypothetical protein